MSQGNSNQMLRQRVRNLEHAVTNSYAALRTATPLMNALLEFFRANEALRPNPFETAFGD